MSPCHAPKMHFKLGCPTIVNPSLHVIVARIPWVILLFVTVPLATLNSSQSVIIQKETEKTMIITNRNLTLQMVAWWW